MRSFEGQRSDNAPIKRTLREKELMLNRLRQELADLKPTVSETVRKAMRQRIADLEMELASAKAAKPSNGPGGASRDGRGGSGRPPRRVRSEGSA